ncbi:MAG: pyruvate, phosphate dikinase [Pseudomonadota bacterium]
MTKWVYTFGDHHAEGSANMKDLLGGKGANLAEMAALGIPVPPGFTISTDVCSHFFGNANSYPDGLSGQVSTALQKISEMTGRVFGNLHKPMLLSIRSGSRSSMPGMMDTVLNLGLNDETVAALASETDDTRFAYDTYRRFIQMFSDVVMHLDHGVFEEILDDVKADHGFDFDTQLTGEHWIEVVSQYKSLFEEELGEPFPQDPMDQLWRAIGAVFSSWNNARAIAYRRLHKIPDEWGTAVTVQAMVFGNRGNTSATGVAFTRNPSTGENTLFGEFLLNAQGEDVVSGIRTPQEITETARVDAASDSPSLEKLMPGPFEQFQQCVTRLEAHYRDMQDVEFTIEDGKLWLLQTRSGKRTMRAALRIAVEMCGEGLITKPDAVSRVDPAALDQLLHPTIAPGAKRDLIGKGLPASPGAACGEIAFDPKSAEQMKAAGHQVILVRAETSPEDIQGMHAADGILTLRGGMTSHAAVVARGMGKPCICGAGTLRLDEQIETLTAMGRTFKKGDLITIDGAAGHIMAGRVAMVQPELSGDFGTIMEWADECRTLDVRANAETPADVSQALSFGADGIGLARTEHMFFEGERLAAIRSLILATDDVNRTDALDQLQDFQRQDFAKLFAACAGKPITIRLIDPPLHEFLPNDPETIEEVAAKIGVAAVDVEQQTASLRETNPMLGHRGCRLAISHPEIVDMQARAIFLGWFDAIDEGREPAGLEIMIPLVTGSAELAFVRERIDTTAKAVAHEYDRAPEYLVGTMIELPRAALMAGSIAQQADFISFGTNDLTQTTYGISRDDAGQWLGLYETRGMLKSDPFVSIDQDGVGELVKIGSERGRQTKPQLKIGICGEHGGDPASIEFFNGSGLDYVSCSPFRIPIARLAAAQAAIADR